MSSIDDLFRTPYTRDVERGTAKRKLEDPTSTFSSKSAKHQSHTSPHSSSYTNGGSSSISNNGSKVASVQDEAPEDDQDVEAGPSLPTDLDDDDKGDDEDGRFFGGGVSKSEREILDFMDQNDVGDSVEEKIDTAWLRRTALSFEKRISKNAEMRAKFEDQPEKFMASEADLDAEIKGLSILAEHTGLYAEFARLGCVGSLVGLLSHENTDIAIDCVELLAELTDVDTGADDASWKALVGEMAQNDVVDLLVANLGRLNEEESEGDRNGIYHILEVAENLLNESSNLEGKPELVKWLLERVKKKIGSKRVGQNQQYAAEVLAILLQTTEKNRTRFIEMDGVDVLLELLARYRQIDPEKDSDEEEWVENLFDCLTCVVDYEAGAQKFLEGEGVELCLIMLREGKMSKPRGLRILDHAMSGELADTVCEKFIEAGCLKTVFGMFMKKQEKEITEHLIGIFASLLRYLPGNSASRIRTLAKFVEKDYEKIDKLLQLRAEYAEKLRIANTSIEHDRVQLSKEEQEDMADEFLSRQLDAGLFPLQTLDVVLAWLVAEDGGARKHIEQRLTDQGSGLGILSASLKEQLDGMDAELKEGVKLSGGKEMLEALLKCI